MKHTFSIFVSSVQKELACERRALKEYITREPHGPLPRNPLIAEPLFRAGYAEKAGSGTTDMIDACRAAGVPEPDFQQHGPHFVVTLWRDWLTDEALAGLGLNERQTKAIYFLKTNQRMTNSDYRNLADVTDRTALRDLEALRELGLIVREGKTGRATNYCLARKPDINPPNPTPGKPDRNPPNPPRKGGQYGP